MKTWNLSNFEEMSSTVVATVDRDSSAQFGGRRRPSSRVRFKSASLSAMGTIIVAAVSFAPCQMSVSGSNEQLRLAPLASVSNVSSERTPLAVFFSVRHELKWDAKTEQQMLERAADAMSRQPGKFNSANLIQSVLREELPQDRDNAVDLSTLGIKLG